MTRDEQKPGGSDEQKPGGSKSETSEEMKVSVSIRIPPFWAERPELWFAQVESQFALHRITSDGAKYNYIVGNLDGNTLQYISDSVINPPAQDKYDHIKQKITECFAESGQKKITKLLSDVQLGDQRPSQLLNRQRTLAGATVNEEFLKSLWLRQLPSNVQAIVAASTANLNELAKLADTIMEVQASSSGVNKVSATTSLEDKIIALAHKFDQFERRSRDTERKAQYASRPHSRSKSQNRNGDLCWYHAKFGNKATNCRKPCSRATDSHKHQQKN